MKRLFVVLSQNISIRKLVVTSLITFVVLLGSARESFGLPECDGSPKDANDSFDETFRGDWDECVGTFMDANLGRKTIGERKGGRLHGQGTLILFAPNKFAGSNEPNLYSQYRNGAAQVTAQ